MCEIENNWTELSAEEIMAADQAHFILDNYEWQQFAAGVNAPPRVIPKLRDLLAGPSVFEEK